MDFVYGSSEASEGDPTPFLFISLSRMNMNEDFNKGLLDTLSSQSEVLKADTEAKALEYLSTPELKAVLVADSDIGYYEHKLLRDCLVEFAKDGGTVVHACVFSSMITPPNFNRYFKYGWGVPWEFGNYYRTEFFLKKSGGHGVGEKKKLPASYSQKVVVLENVAAADAVYLPKPESRTQSNVFSAEPIKNLNETPVAFTKIGSGRLGYVGDVNHEKGSNSVILAMFGML